MYPAIKANIQRIANEAYPMWKIGGDVETFIKKELREANMSDWLTDARMELSRVIHAEHLNSKLV